MPDNEGFDPEDYEGIEQKMATLPRAEVRRFEKDRRELAQLREQLAAQSREAAFLRAGIPVDDPAAKYFVRGYDGELTVEAIKAAAVEARIIATTATSPEEQRAHEAAQAAAAGGTPPGVGPNLEAQLAEMGRKTFAPSDDVGRTAHIQEIARLAREAGVRIPLS